MRKDLIDKIKNYDFTDYNIKFKIRERGSFIDGSYHQLIIKYKKKKSLFYNKIYKNLENFTFAFTDIITLADLNNNKDLEIFQYLKKYPEDNILEDIVKYCIKKEIDIMKNQQEENQISKVPLKWLFYTNINTDKSE